MELDFTFPKSVTIRIKNEREEEGGERRLVEKEGTENEDRNFRN